MKTPDEVQDIHIVPEYAERIDGMVGIRMTVEGLTADQAEFMAKKLLETVHTTLRGWGQLISLPDDEDTVQ
jgi:hypothetical protein